MIDVGYAEPLHNGNNGWQFWHSFVLELGLGKSPLPVGCHELDKLPGDSPFICYLSCLRINFGLIRLVKKVKKWFTEGRKKSLITDSLAKRQRKCVTGTCSCLTVFVGKVTHPKPNLR